MRHNLTTLLMGILLALPCTCTVAQPTVRLNATNTHQRVTGFGGFVCSPQFQYNHMSTTEIKKVWGTTSTIGCNIMRLYIPIGRNAWSQSLATAKTAKQMGLIVFASPWGQPAEWKTNGTSNAKNSDGTLGYLKRENWADYAQYLEDYVQYMRNNGVELDAISIQNEPDWAASYAGCLWSASEIAEFVKLYGPSISCKVMAPETLSVNDEYANALNNSDVLPGFEIYGGHQYGGIQSAYKQLAQKGKEIWMTEYLINWNETENNTRNFDFSKDFFNFFRAINVCMLGDFNAWIHYAAKRYYGMLGDGQRGTTNGIVTKRGYIMAHFAKHVTGKTRIDIDFGTTPLEGSAYISEAGDSVVAVIANDTDDAVEITMDLPFYTQGGKLYKTTKTTSMIATTLTMDSETCHPIVTIPAKSVCTVLFLLSRERQPSNMTGKKTRFDRLDDMTATKTGFGTTYKMSGKTKTFDHSNPLISTKTNANNGYVALDDRYSRLVIEVKKVTSTLNYSSAKTTLIYVNAAGEVSQHDYGDLDLSRRENFSLIFDLSPATLTDGCIGIISMTNNNWSSTLSMTLGDVTLDNGSYNYAATLTGTYVEDDSYVYEYTNDAHCTSFDMTGCTAGPWTLPWLIGTNRVVWMPAWSSVGGPNLINGEFCPTLMLSSDGGDFRPAKAFQAGEITFTTTVDKCQLIMLPFNAVIPEGAKAYTLDENMELIQMRSIPAHQPVLIEGQGEMTITGQGDVAFTKSPVNNMLRGTYTAIPLYAGDYVLATQDGKWGFRRVESAETLSPFGVYATLASDMTFVPLPQQDILSISTTNNVSTDSAPTYDLTGRRITTITKHGLYIRNNRIVNLSK